MPIIPKPRRIRMRPQSPSMWGQEVDDNVYVSKKISSDAGEQLFSKWQLSQQPPQFLLLIVIIVVDTLHSNHQLPKILLSTTTATDTTQWTNLFINKYHNSSTQKLLERNVGSIILIIVNRVDRNNEQCLMVHDVQVVMALVTVMTVMVVANKEMIS